MSVTTPSYLPKKRWAFPDVEVSEMKDFEVERLVADIGDEDVDGIIEVFRQQQGSWEAVDREAVDGDEESFRIDRYW